MSKFLRAVDKLWDINKKSPSDETTELLRKFLTEYLQERIRNFSVVNKLRTISDITTDEGIFLDHGGLSQLGVIVAKIYRKETGTEPDERAEYNATGFAYMVNAYPTSWEETIIEEARKLESKQK